MLPPIGKDGALIATTCGVLTEDEDSAAKSGGGVVLCASTVSSNNSVKSINSLFGSYVANSDPEHNASELNELDNSYPKVSIKAYRCRWYLCPQLAYRSNRNQVRHR